MPTQTLGLFHYGGKGEEKPNTRPKRYLIGHDCTIGKGGRFWKFLLVYVVPSPSNFIANVSIRRMQTFVLMIAAQDALFSYAFLWSSALGESFGR